VKIAKVHSSEQFYSDRFDEANVSLLNMEYMMQKNWSLPQLIQRIAGLLVLVGIVWFGYRSGSVPMASFVILVLLFSRIFPQMISMNTDISMIISNVASVKLVIELDEGLPGCDVRIARFGLKGEDLKEGIRLEGFSFSYPDGSKLFDGFSGEIEGSGQSRGSWGKADGGRPP